MFLHIKSVIVLLVLASLVFGGGQTVLGQNNAAIPQELFLPKQQPPMENVFFNVLWGSVTGGLLSMGWATLDDKTPDSERFGPSHLSTQFLYGATLGGLLGLATGVYLSIKGITFDESRSRISLFPSTIEDPHHSQHATFSEPSSINEDIHLVNLKITF